MLKSTVLRGKVRPSQEEVIKNKVKLFNFSYVIFQTYAFFEKQESDSMKLRCLLSLNSERQEFYL